MNNDKVDVFVQAAVLLHNKDYASAEKVINEKYPFIPVKTIGRSYTTKQMVTQFFNDGFVDRYSGKRLVNPGILRVMSEMLPKVFPYQAHWKTEECHMAYWDLQPTIDHIYPVSLGGEDAPKNWATTSMVNNSIKNNFTLEQLGWTLKEKGNILDWDGLSKLFVEIVEQNKTLLGISRVKSYYMATKQIMEQRVCISDSFQKCSDQYFFDQQ